MAIPREHIIDATTEEIREEFVKIIDKLAIIKDRDARLECFKSCLTTLSENARNLVDLFSRKEQQHIDHVRITMRRITEFANDRPLHDFSKDRLYFFVTTSKFDCQVKCDSLDELFRIETGRHFELEPHHEQYERIHDKECSEDDIREMAIDRMSRSIQSNQGFVNMEDMNNYFPNFPLGDNKKKQEIFGKFIQEYKGITEDTYHSMMPSKV